MSDKNEAEKIQKYLERIILKIEKSFKTDAPEELVNSLECLEYIPEIPEIDQLTQPDSLNQKYDRENPRARACKACSAVWLQLQKSKTLLDEGKTIQCIDALMEFHFNLGKLDQNLQEEIGIEEAKRASSKIGTDKQHDAGRKIREKACELLRTHRPKNGWENRNKATEAILGELNEFTQKNLSGLSFKLTNLPFVLKDWIENKENVVGKAYIETASEKWHAKYAPKKENPDPNKQS